MGGTQLERYSLAIVAYRPQAFQAVWLRALAVHPKIDLMVYYLSQTRWGGQADSFLRALQQDASLLDGYPHCFPPRRTGGLGVLGATENSTQPSAWGRPLYELRRWLAPTPALRNLLRFLYWDVLRQHDNLLVVAEKAT